VIGLPSQLARRRALAGGAVVVVAIVAALVVVVDPFGSSAPAASVDNGSPTATATIAREDLTQQTQVSATLGYADPSVVSVPAGTAPSSLQQAQQAADTASAALAQDANALEQARASLAADSRKLTVECSGEGAAQSASSSAGAGGNASPCVTDAHTVATDQQSIATATPKVQADGRSLAAADAALAQAETSASAYGASGVYTMLPPVGRVVTRGGALYAVDGQPVVLLYGGVPQARAFVPGMSSGADVAELNANLRALGYDAPAGDAFTGATSGAVEALQRARGLPATGTLLLGAVVFENGAVRVTSVTPTAGAAVQPGPALGITSTRRVVTIALDASQQSNVKVGDRVTITLPDNSTTPGHVSYVGTVATTPSNNNNGGGSSSPTIEVDVEPDHPGATGRLDQAPVDVSITTASVDNVLVVPVNALLALSSGGYAVEQVTGAGVHQLVGVTVGLFDDALGLVQVSGSNLAPGQRVVVPAQ